MKYINIFLFLFILIFRTLSFANMTLIECHLSNSKYTGVISLGSIGQGIMKFKSKDASSDNHWTTCPLFIHDIEDPIGGISTVIDFTIFNGTLWFCSRKL